MKGFGIYFDGTEIIIDENSTLKVAEKIKKYGGSKVLLLYGMGSIKKYGILDKIESVLKKERVDFISLGGIKPNPVVKKVYEAVSLAREENIDFILAVGGGSVIDTAKAVAANFYEGGDVWDYYTGKRIAQRALPLGVVLTIPATGSESNPYSVLSNGDDKRSTASRVFLPKFSILDPINTYSLPREQTAYGFIDMFVHIAEQYFVNEDGGYLRDYFCEAGFRTITDIALKVLENPKDKDLRMESFWVGNIALSGFLMKGIRGSGDWTGHALEHQFSAINDMPHGKGLAVVFPAWLEVVSMKRPEKVKRFFKNVFEKETLDKGFKALRGFFESLGVDTYLMDGSIKEADIDKIVKRVTKKGVIGNYLKLNGEDIGKIIKISLKLS